MEAAIASPSNHGTGKDLFPIQDDKHTKKCRSVLYTPTQNCGILLHIGKERKKKPTKNSRNNTGSWVEQFLGSVSHTPSSDV